MQSVKEMCEFSEKWVQCVNCSHEYVKDTFFSQFETKGCPVCGSHTCDDSTISDWREQT